MSNNVPVSVFHGDKIKLSVFGTSHGEKIGVTAEGFPVNEKIDFDKLSRFMDRRRAKNNVFSTTRLEPDEVMFESGIKDGLIKDGSFTASIKNKVQKSADYGEELKIIRPGHADYTGYVKYGKDFDFKGGGQFSGRMTAPLCIAGGIAKQILEKSGIKIHAFIEEIGKIKGVSGKDVDFNGFDFSDYEEDFPLLDKSVKKDMESEISFSREKGDSVGGIIGCAVTGVPEGLGDAIFGAVESEISALAFAVPAVKGIQFGEGFSFSSINGSVANDPFTVKDGKVITLTNKNGGINGGITNGMPIYFSVVIKPTPSIFIEQDSVDITKMENVKLKIKGRHDACIAVRAVPVIEAITAIALLDKML